MIKAILTYKINCDNEECLESIDIDGKHETKQSIKETFQSVGWTFIGKKCYCENHKHYANSVNDEVKKDE